MGEGALGVDLNEVADRLANAGMLGESISAPLDLAATVVAATEAAAGGSRFVVKAKWSAPCKACGERYSRGANVTKNEVGWVHAACV